MALLQSIQSDPHSVFPWFPPQWVINYKLSSLNNLVQEGKKCACAILQQVITESLRLDLNVYLACLHPLLPPHTLENPSPPHFQLIVFIWQRGCVVKREERRSRGFRRCGADTLISQVYQSLLLSPETSMKWHICLFDKNKKRAVMEGEGQRGLLSSAMVEDSTQFKQQQEKRYR